MLQKTGIDEDFIGKKKLDVILLVDVSKSMNGERINQVNDAIKDVKEHLISLEEENINVNFGLTIIPFGTDSYFLNDQCGVDVREFKFKELTAKGQTNLELAYEKLNSILRKTSNGGIMSDYGGYAPIIMLLTDGHPGHNYKEQLSELRKRGWFNASLRYGLAIGLEDDKTMKVLNDFVGTQGEVIKCYNSNVISQIIKIVILTASKVKSSSKNINNKEITNNNSNNACIQQIHGALKDINEVW